VAVLFQFFRRDENEFDKFAGSEFERRSEAQAARRAACKDARSNLAGRAKHTAATLRVAVSFQFSCTVSFS